MRYPIFGQRVVVEPKLIAFMSTCVLSCLIYFMKYNLTEKAL